MSNLGNSPSPRSAHVTGSRKVEPQQTQDLLSGLGLTPVPEWYDTPAGADGYPVGMPTDEKASDELAGAAEHREMAKKASSSRERAFWQSHARRSLRYARRLTGQRPRSHAGSRGAGRPKGSRSRRVRATRAGPSDDPAESGPARPAAAQYTLSVLTKDQRGEAR